MQTQKPVGMLLKQIHDEMERASNAMLREIDLTASQMRVLFFLAQQAPQAVSQRQLQQHLGVSHPTVVGLLGRLEQKQLVERRADESDRRCRRFALSEKFFPLSQDMLRHRQRMEARLLEGLSPQEIAQLKRSLSHIYDNLSKPS